MKGGDFQETVKDAVKIYLDFMTCHHGGEEIQYRTPLENLINSIKLPYRDFSIIQEDRHSGIEVAGTPDFFVYEDDHTLLKRLVGFILPWGLIPRRSTSDTSPTLPYRVKQAAKRQAKQLDAVLRRGGLLPSTFAPGMPL
jgi:hypothetical protein